MSSTPEKLLIKPRKHPLTHAVDLLRMWHGVASEHPDQCPVEAGDLEHAIQTILALRTTKEDH